VSFDDAGTPGRPLNGQYPSGVIDWSSNAWYLSGPYGRFNTQSVSFNGSGPTSAAFSLVSPQRVVQIDAYNGGTAASTISLSCAGQTPRSQSVAAGQVATIVTGWAGSCSSVTVGSSNGWDTNFDNLMISTSGGGATATAVPATATPTRTTAPTSTPTATPVRTNTPVATATPVSGGQTLNFDSLANPNRPLNGQYPSGVADWGTNVWYLSSPWGQFRTQSISFNGAGPTSAPVRFLTALRVVSLDAYNGGGTSSTVTLSCSGLPTVSATLAANQVQTITTNWTSTCATLTITSSNGWNTNFDNVVIQ
jgi:hypothetical protein